MINDKPNNRANKRKKSENATVEPAVMKTLNNSFIFYLTRPSNKFPKAKFICKMCTYHLDDVERALKHSSEALHQKNLKKLAIRNLLTYLPGPTKTQLEAIEDCLKNALVEGIFINKEEYERRMQLSITMNQLVAEIYSGYNLFICGSLLTRLSLINGSDVNLYLSSDFTKTSSYLEVLEKLGEVFKAKLNLKPEIKLEKNNSGLFCKDKFGISYHISASNENQYLTSGLVRLYLLIDSRAYDLARLFRYFARKAFIDRVSDGLFPSHVFPMLVIFYLQQLTVPILPNLHKLARINVETPSEFITQLNSPDGSSSYVNDLAWVRKIWIPPTNDASLAELWIGMLKFYVSDFNCGQYIVSIRSEIPVLKSERHMVNKRLAVEDPFDVKRNILFGWNSIDVIDFLHDQLHGCYTYFAIPQLRTGPLFTKVSFTETTLTNMKPSVNVTPTFTLNDFTATMEILDILFKKIYNEEKTFYDISKWPIELFIKTTLAKILTVIFNAAVDIQDFITILELKIRSGLSLDVDSYTKFYDYANKLAKSVIHEFSDHFEDTNSWNHTVMESAKAFELIKKSSQRFINESLNLNDKELEDDSNDELGELNDLEDMNTDPENVEEVVDIDLDENYEDLGSSAKEQHMKHLVQSTESWKRPIAFKLIFTPVKGVVKSGENNDEYNEKRVNDLNKQDFNYVFNNIQSIHTKKLVITCSLCNTKGHRKENCPYAIPRFEDLQDILKTVNGEWLSKLSVVLNEKYNTVTPKIDQLKQNEKIFEKITEIIKSLYPTARPQLFGSTLNGFSTKSSDLDICLEFYEDDKRIDLSNKELTSRLRAIGREIKKMANMRVDYILRAKVPIIKFFMKNNVQGDISINNILGIHNTRMLKIYADIGGDNVKKLGNIIKCVAKICKIGDASQGTLSSYAYIIMMVHFLQKRNVLPVLQELYEGVRPMNIIDGWDAWYQSDISIINKLWKKKNTEHSLDFLWLDFLYYYAVEFDIDKEVVSIKQSKPLYKIDKNWNTSYMAIEDPFNLNHNLSGNLSLENCRYILECFAHILKMQTNPENLVRSAKAHLLLFEPTCLIPDNAGGRVCYNCNKPGHIARDCGAVTQKQTPTKPIVQQSSLPELPAPLRFKLAEVPNNFYLHSEFNEGCETEQSNTIHVPLKSLKADINQYSLVPITLKFGDQTVILPVLVGKSDVIDKKLNTLLKNGLNNRMCSLPANNINRLNGIPYQEQFPTNLPIRPMNKMPLQSPHNVPMIFHHQSHQQPHFNTPNRTFHQQNQQYFEPQSVRMRSNGPNNLPPGYSIMDMMQAHINYQQQQQPFLARTQGPSNSMNSNNVTTPRGKKK